MPNRRHPIDHNTLLCVLRASVVKLLFIKNQMMERQTRKQIRLSEYDYSSNGYYFVTICSKDRKNLFCRIDQNIDNPVPQGHLLRSVVTGLAPVKNENSNIKLSIPGKIINDQWHKIPKQFENVGIDAFVIMPNHVHGIIVVNKKSGASPDTTIPGIVGSFKSKSSIEYLKYIKQNNLKLSGKIWQRSFYDHIIRNEESLKSIREYIRYNPSTWDKDENNIFRETLDVLHNNYEG